MANLPPTKRSGTGFTNLQRILQANKGANLGQALAGKVDRDVGGVQKTLAGASDQFKKGVQESALNTQENIARRGGVISNIVNPGIQPVGNQKAPVTQPSKGISPLPSSGQKFQPGGGLAPIQGEPVRPITPATLVEPTEEDVAKFGTFREGRYLGPTEVSQGSQILGQAQDLSDLGRGVGSTEGRFGLLGKYFGSPGYTTGQKRLDNLLLTPEAAQLSKLRRATTGLQTDVGSELFQNKALAQLQTRANEEFADETRALLGIDKQGNVTEGQGALGGVQKSIDDRLAEYLKVAGDDERIKNILATNDVSGLSRGELSRIGLQGNLLGPTYNTKLSDYFQPVNTNLLNRSSVASLEDSAKLDALNRLSGSSDKFLGDRSQVGSQFNRPEAKIALDKLTQAKNLAKGAFEQEMFNPNTFKATGNVPGISGGGASGPGGVIGYTQGTLKANADQARKILNDFARDPILRTNRDYQQQVDRANKILQLEKDIMTKHGANQYIKQSS